MLQCFIKKRNIIFIFFSTIFQGWLHVSIKVFKKSSIFPSSFYRVFINEWSAAAAAAAIELFAGSWVEQSNYWLEWIEWMATQYLFLILCSDFFFFL